MSTSANVNEPVSKSFLSPQDRTRGYAAGGPRPAIWLLIAVIGLGLAGIYLSSLIHSADLPDLGQFFGP
jgi:hypothetical protein